ncbi:MAG: Fe-S cluster assembly ATPase SufC [Candidatus Melainabacteria bacterium RIFCSPHIGHO2_02_FULL_34_12]|nr:MAG: Fe-S cluster assembly ATPase SufC [Candidatus Melainabacteria bacterium RIFCSPHIGHO2_02_FULL_34_12]
MTELLKIKNLHVEIDKKEILQGLNLQMNEGEVHAVMGRNGSGKSTFSNTLMGHPAYKVSNGQITFNGKSINSLKPNERAKLGLFLAFQYPLSIPGVTVANFLRQANKAIKGDAVSPRDFRKILYEKMDDLEIDHLFATRYINEGFSGGEKKRMEILQMAMLEPKLAILDEPDSGLDIDSLKLVADSINKFKEKNPQTGILLITHYQRILDYVRPDKVHVFADGNIVESGGPELALKLESKGYDWLTEKEPAIGRTGVTAKGQ